MMTSTMITRVSKARMTNLLLPLLIMAIGFPAWVQAAPLDSEAVSFRWEHWDETNRAFLESQRQTLIARGATVQDVESDQAGVKNPAAVWLVMAGVAAVSVLAETLVQAVKDLTQCGMIVEVKNGETVIRRSCDLNGGEVLGIKADGSIVKLEFTDKSPSEAVELMKALLRKAR